QRQGGVGVATPQFPFESGEIPGGGDFLVDEGMDQPAQRLPHFDDAAANRGSIPGVAASDRKQLARVSVSRDAGFPCPGEDVRISGLEVVVGGRTAVPGCGVQEGEADGAGVRVDVLWTW